MEVLLGVVQKVVEHLKYEKPQMAQQLWKDGPGWLNEQELKPPAESGGDALHVSGGGRRNFP